MSVPTGNANSSKHAMTIEATRPPGFSALHARAVK